MQEEAELQVMRQDRSPGNAKGPVIAGTDPKDRLRHSYGVVQMLIFCMTTIKYCHHLQARNRRLPSHHRTLASPASGYADDGCSSGVLARRVPLGTSANWRPQHQSRSPTMKNCRRVRASKPQRASHACDQMSRPVKAITRVRESK